MKSCKFLIVAAVFVSLSSFRGEKKKAPAGSLPASNPFSSKSTLLYQAPDFKKIKDADFKPALEAGIKEKRDEINSIANNPAPPTFENTLVALEKAGQLLTRTNNVFSLFTGANTNPELQAVKEVEAPKLAALQDAIYLNAKLFKRVETLYNKRNQLKLDAESKTLVEYYYQQFVIAGARLSEADKTKLKQLNEEEAVLSAKFESQLLAASKAGGLIIEDTAELAGLSQADRDAFAAGATAKGLTGKWLIPLQNTTTQPSLQSMSNRAARQKLFEASWMRAERGDTNDTRAGITKIALVRIKKADLVGQPNFAAWKLQDQMAKTPEAVNKFLSDLALLSTKKARTEAADIQALIDRQNGGFKLQPWDWDFYAEQVRKEKYDLDESQIKPYFELFSVLEKGVFYAANQMYGLTFKERKDLPTYQQDVRVFEVFDKDGKSFALFYGDYFKRDNKSGGAWMDNLVGQSTLLGTNPVIYNVCNFTKPATGQPALISYDDVRTMFHEFGHALHGLFSSQKYPTISGTSVARDFVEFPSQFNEHWGLDPKVLKNYAKHYQTGEPIPQALIDKIKKSASFNQGYSLTEKVAASALDMQWHSTADTTAIKDVDAFETAALQRTNLDMPEVPSRYRTSYFLHIWSHGYSAGYYAYQWTKMLEEDAYVWFMDHGGMTRENGQRYRDMILSRGNTVELGKMFRDFAGHDPSLAPMKKELGLDEGQ